MKNKFFVVALAAIVLVLDLCAGAIAFVAGYKSMALGMFVTAAIIGIGLLIFFLIKIIAYSKKNKK